MLRSAKLTGPAFGAALLATTALTSPAALAQSQKPDFASANAIQADVSGYFGRNWMEMSYGTRYKWEERGVSGRVNLPFAGVFNLEFEAGAQSRAPWNDSLVGAFAHLYWRDPSRFALGIFGGYTNPYDARFYSFGGEAQLYLGSFTLYAQGSRGTSDVSCSSCPTETWQGRGSIQWFVTPGTNLAVDGLYTRYSEINSSDLNVATVILTGTQQLGSSPLALFLQGRYENSSYTDSSPGAETFTARAGVRLLLGPAGSTLQSIARTGPAMDTVTLQPIVIQRPSCFIGSTKILMADGTRRRVDAVQVGDEVLGENGELNRVVEIETPLLGDRKLYGFNGAEAFTTVEHPFKTRDGWKSLDPAATFTETKALEVAPLEVGAEFVTLAAVIAEELPMRAAGGGRGPVPMVQILVETGYTALEAISEFEADPKTPVYNLRLADNHTYFANGYLVHNR